MRTIDTNGLVRLGLASDGPWRIGENLLLRGSFNRRPMRSLEEAQAGYDAYRAAWETGIGSPEPHEVVRTPDGWGILVEYVPGLGIGSHLAWGSFTLAEAARETAELQRRMHGTHMAAGIDWNAMFRGFARELRPLLPDPLGRGLCELMEAAPPSDALLHGDLHFGNLIVHGGRLVPIDLERAGHGQPMLDLAISRSRISREMLCGDGLPVSLEQAYEFVREYWHIWLHSYLGEPGEDEYERVDRGLEVLAKVESLCFARDVPRSLSDTDDDFWVAGIGQLAELLEERLGEMEGLWAWG